ncbi:MAG: hypothetical protein AB7O32_14880 [Vicinamibacterales bacterium]
MTAIARMAMCLLLAGLIPGRMHAQSAPREAGPARVLVGGRLDRVGVRQATTAIQGATTTGQPSTPGDRLADGALFGAAVGFAGGFLGLAAYNAAETASGPIWDAEAIGIYTSVGLLGAGIGAGLGLAIDAARHRAPGTAVSVQPVLGRRARGLRISIQY